MVGAITNRMALFSHIPLFLMGGSWVPKIQLQFLYLPCLQKTISKDFGGASGQLTLWRAKLYPCIVLRANQNGKISRQNFEADVFPSGAGRPLKGLALELGAYYLLRPGARKSSVGKRILGPMSPLRRFSPLISDK
ncbi:hypothetical protein TNCV_3197291 [Trichonephila clavipes]|nr:hypothetical protein TNCV_3197291 [Trichonephila clavipes]